MPLNSRFRKVGHVLFNPSAENILASASGDFTIKIWDVATGQSPITLKHNDIVQSLSWNASGNMLVTTSRDKKIRVWDVRQENPVHEAPGHAGAKNSRAVWLGEHNRFATTGFSKMSERQIALWEPGNPDPIGGFTMLDTTSGVCMPFWGEFVCTAAARPGSMEADQDSSADEGSNCLYLAGKGYDDHSGDSLPRLFFCLHLVATATFDTTSTRTTSLSTLASTSRLILSAALPSFRAAASTYVVDGH